MYCPLCSEPMKIAWRAPFEENVFKEKDFTYEVISRPAAFIADCRPCGWQEIYDRIPGTKMHAAQFGEMLDIFWKHSK